ARSSGSETTARPGARKQPALAARSARRRLPARARPREPLRNAWDSFHSDDRPEKRLNHNSWMATSGTGSIATKDIPAHVLSEKNERTAQGSGRSQCPITDGGRAGGSHDGNGSVFSTG